MKKKIDYEKIFGAPNFSKVLKEIKKEDKKKGIKYKRVPRKDKKIIMGLIDGKYKIVKETSKELIIEKIKKK